MHLLFAVCLAAAQVKYPPRPAQGQYVFDLAEAVDAGDEAEINKIAAETLREKRAPIHVVTVKSLAEMGAGDWPIERYAMNLFAEWGIGWPEWNHGMLLVVSVGDRKARIELGGGWGRRMDENAQRIMERKIVPEFKRGRMSAGVLEGVKALRGMALGLGPPPGTDGGGGSPLDRIPGAPKCGGGMMWIVVIVIAVVVLGSLFRRRTSAWGPGGIGGMSPGCGSFGSGCLGAALGNMLFGGLGGGFGGGGRRFGGGGGGGGWSGGSRGGGFSGGGGATGSW